MGDSDKKMTKDGNILEELIKLNHGYKFSGVRIYSLPTLKFEKVNYTKFMKIRRLSNSHVLYLLLSFGRSIGCNSLIVVHSPHCISLLNIVHNVYEILLQY